MPVEGIASVFSAVMGHATTLFSYFHPSKSPYYGMSVAGIVGICALFFIERASWLAALIPISLVLILLALATLTSSKYLFTVDEYNDQLKFARSLAITTAIVCLVVVAINPNNPLGYESLGGRPITPCDGDCGDRPAIFMVYIICLAQILLFLAYVFLFKDYNENVAPVRDEFDPAASPAQGANVAEHNNVQIALVMCAYLAGMTVISNRVPKTYFYETLSLALFGLIWLSCAVKVALFIRRNFRLQPPTSRAQPLTNPRTNIVTFRQMKGGSGS
jgi:hypothetical protein